MKAFLPGYSQTEDEGENELEMRGLSFSLHSQSSSLLENDENENDEGVFCRGTPGQKKRARMSRNEGALILPSFSVLLIIRE